MQAWRALVVVPFVGCGPTVVPSHPNDDLIRDQDRACAVDADCVIVDAQCCNCNNDGDRTAIHRDARASVDARRADACGDGACDAAISDDETCCAEGAGCVADVCELIGERGRQKGDGVCE